jgi:hypothetical protein
MLDKEGSEMGEVLDKRPNVISVGEGLFPNYKTYQRYLCPE